VIFPPLTPNGFVMIWMQSKSGGVVDLANPRAADVNFLDVAHALSHINRFAGHSEKPVSVALHTLIVFDAADERDRAYALLRDAHEAYIGDIIEPTARALADVARSFHDAPCVIKAIEALKTRHDKAICEAAGIPSPSPETRQRIRRADLIALQTERRDFLGLGHRSWGAEIELHKPLRKHYRFRAPPDVADELYARFKKYLPGLGAHAA
jgi:hypothetical protein